MESKEVTYVNVARRAGKSKAKLLGAIVSMKLQAQVVGYDAVNQMFEIKAGMRFTYNDAHFRSIAQAVKPKVRNNLELVDWEVSNNTALYLSPSYLVRTLVTKRFDEQVNALQGFIAMQKRAGSYELTLTASEWLLFARACEYALKTELSGLALKDGVDLHAEDILNSIDGNQIDGVIARVKKQSDVPFVQWREAGEKSAWHCAVSDL